MNQRMRFGCLAIAFIAIGTASANSVESDLRCTSRVYLDNVTLTSHNVTLTSQKPSQYNSNSETKSYNTFHKMFLKNKDALNEV